MGRPASFSRRFITSLSMPTAEPSTEAPTKGTSAIFSSPCTVPSSPKGPCSTGKTTSIGPAAAGFAAATTSGLPPPAGSRWTGLAESLSRIRFGSSASSRKAAASCFSQRPALSMPMSVTSYLSWSMASNTFFADCRETSCSADFPPNRSPTRIF